MILRRVAGWPGALAREFDPVGGASPPSVGRPAYAAVAVLAVVVGAVAGGRVASASPAEPVLAAVALGVAQGLPLVLAPVRPLAGFLVSVAVGVLVSEAVRAGGPGSVWAEPSLLAHLGVLAVVGLRCRARVLPVLWLATLLAGAVLVQRMPGMNASPDLVEMSMLSAVVLVAAGALRGRREALRRLAAQERISEAERLRRSVLEERALIARELHDVVAHHMTLIAIQAEAAPYRVDAVPPELAHSFTTIRGSAVEAMTELRRVLGVLRDPGDASPSSAGPQPRLGDLGRLVDAVRGAGSEVELSVTGDVRPLDPGVELSGYRIVQEALSNAVRHAPGSAVRVEVVYEGVALRLCVVNGPSSAVGGAGSGVGHGLVGMRERVAMFGGELSVGPRPDGGYGVAAVLPLHPPGASDRGAGGLPA